MKSVIKTVLLSYTTLIISVISSCQQEEEEVVPPTVTDLVVDLRYNPGGETDVAQYLASALAPASVVSSEEVLVCYHYNDLLESYLLAREGEDSESLLSRFIPNSHNLNLNQVYFLTSQGTASASELLISGLDLG